MREPRFLLTHAGLERRMASLGGKVEIPTLPELYLRVREIIESPSGNAAKIAALLANEPGLSVKILRTVNSPAYGLRQQATKVEQAVAFLGMTEVANIVLSATLLKKFPAKPGHRKLDMRKFWEHSIGTGTMARILGAMADKSARININDTFVAGLIHDIGKLMLYQNFPDEFSMVLDLCKSEKTTMLKAETKVFGFSHQDIGALVTDQWGFSRNMVKALELHNTPDELDTGDESYTFTCLVHVADVFAHALRFGEAGDPFIPVFSGSAFDALAIDLRAVPLILSQGRESFQEVRELVAG